MRPAVASLLLIAACRASDGAPATEQATVTDSAGITIVQNHRPIWGEGEGWKVSAEPVLVIADTMATGEGRSVMNAARLSNGDVVLLTDRGGRWFDPTGMLLRTFAPIGDGPGEFRHADQLLVLSGDTIVVGALGLRSRIAHFGPNGALIREVHTDVEQLLALGRWGECGGTLFPDLSRSGCQEDPSIPESPTNRRNRPIGEGWVSPGPGLLRHLSRLYRIPPALDTIYALGVDIGIEQQMVSIGGRETSLRHPFHAMSAMDANGSPMRIAIATNPHWEIGVWTPEGHLVHIIRVDGGRRVPTSVELAMADSMVREPNSWYVSEEPGFVRDELLTSLEVPDSLPGHTGLLMDAGGRILSRRWGHWHHEVPNRFDVFSADGRWLGTLELPPKFRLIEVGGDYLLGVQYDEDDVPSVVVYGLER